MECFRLFIYSEIQVLKVILCHLSIYIISIIYFISIYYLYLLWCRFDLTLIWFILGSPPSGSLGSPKDMPIQWMVSCCVAASVFVIHGVTYPHRNVLKTWRILKLNRCSMMFIPPKLPNWVAETGDGLMALIHVSVPLENTAGVPQVYRIDCQSHVDAWVMTSITNQHGKVKCVSSNFAVVPAILNSVKHMLWRTWTDEVPVPRWLEFDQNWKPQRQLQHLLYKFGVLKTHQSPKKIPHLAPSAHVEGQPQVEHIFWPRIWHLSTKRCGSQWSHTLQSFQSPRSWKVPFKPGNHHSAIIEEEPAKYNTT